MSQVLSKLDMKLYIKFYPSSNKDKTHHKCIVIHSQQDFKNLQKSKDNLKYTINYKSLYVYNSLCIRLHNSYHLALQKILDQNTCKLVLKEEGFEIQKQSCSRLHILFCQMINNLDMLKDIKSHQKKHIKSKYKIIHKMQDQMIQLL
ncbi:hypothetical protein TTHERM_000238748 (macronuclear) [Tetrahymena thermophila SB210]|uniref:Uncharacterized protein n=1 Tax=Tetrahymena thermophila (strain SB210) TaxID=312017 RepID=W7WY36_TETTS|nr:hypothetical protein TTHERM_000238748 [Tetrahymena thermophila SB210]EWS71775.1 hypothetical protein TTHERM_000238748 [Tetrahymena thermophila SB210]|eukprot:XP_012655662.1 hypothetical protein TTHERM_000238748 [Tetrahymena thermophila SB210]